MNEVYKAMGKMKYVGEKVVNSVKTRASQFAHRNDSPEAQARIKKLIGHESGKGR